MSIFFLRYTFTISGTNSCYKLVFLLSVCQAPPKFCSYLCIKLKKSSSRNHSLSSEGFAIWGHISDCGACWQIFLTAAQWQPEELLLRLCRDGFVSAGQVSEARMCSMFRGLKGAVSPDLSELSSRALFPCRPLWRFQTQWAQNTGIYLCHTVRLKMETWTGSSSGWGLDDINKRLHLMFNKINILH